MIQLPDLLYAIAEEADGRRDYDEIAERVSERFQRGLGADDVRMLADEQLRPLGVLAQADGSSPRLRKLDPLLGLRLRAALVPESAVQAAARIFAPLFHPVAILAVVGGLLVVDAWLFFVHGVAQGARAVAYEPLWMVGIAGLIVLGTAWHELGHASALRYGGGKPGAMGAGIYVVWPAFYTDVTDAYRLGRWGRIRTDLGGIYFNAIFVLALTGLYALVGHEALLIAIVLVHLQVLQQFLPFLRLDGYYLVSDLTGVPDLFARIKPTLKGALPGSEPDAEAKALKPWVRRATTVWVLTVIPVLLLVFGLLVFNAPRMIATAWDSLGVQVDAIGGAVGDGDALTATASGLRSLFLVLPLAGLAYTFSKLGWRVTDGAWSWSEGSAPRRTLVVAIAGTAVAVAGYVLAPNGDYRPIQAGERGTIQGGVAQFRHVPSGRPGLTPAREEQLGGIEERGPGNEEPQQGGTTGASTSTSTSTGTTTTDTQTTTTETTTTETTTTETTTTETTP